MKKLYFKEKFFKITDHYPILDENGRESYYIDQDFTFLGYRSRVTDKDGREILSIDRQLFHLLPRYDISLGDGSRMVVQKRLAFFRQKVDVSLKDDTLSLKGDIFSLNFDIINEQGKPVGSVNRKFFALTDTYELTIYDQSYTEELIGLVLCLNNMVDLDQARSSSAN